MGGESTTQRHHDIADIHSPASQWLDEPDGIAARDVLVTMDGGYMFTLPDARFDLHVYQQLVSDGIGALRSGRDHEARHALTDALALWKGDALADVRHGRVLESEAARLEESRLRTLEHRIEADLRLGRNWEVLEELSMLTMRHPLYENLHMQYMVALYRSGHRLDALQVFHRLRAALVQEVGIEPTSRLQQLHQLILTTDASVDELNNAIRTVGAAIPGKYR
jgi:DNA-binding SARP family transcriptional activator